MPPVLPSTAASPLGATAARLRRIGFLTLPGYSMIALSSALEPCRMANYVAGRQVYTCTLLTVDGAPAAASNGLSLGPTARLGDPSEGLDLLIACGGVDVRNAVSRGTRELLRRSARHGIALGSLCTGTFALAEAGLLGGYRCAVHWENLAALREEFPDVAFQDDAFVIDRDRLTCTGGIAPLDMMLVLIAAALGTGIATKVADQFIVRGAVAKPQKPLLAPELAARCPELARAAEMMARHLDRPVPVSDVAAATDLSHRQLERLFRRHLSISPAAFYRELRLERARELLRLSPMRVTEVAIACGFQSAAHFSAVYTRHFGHPPRAERSIALPSPLPSPPLPSPPLPSPPLPSPSASSGEPIARPEPSLPQPLPSPLPSPGRGALR